MLTIEEEEEIQERQAAELEFVESAYSKDEAWILHGRNKFPLTSLGVDNDDEEEEIVGNRRMTAVNPANKVYRCLELHIADDGCHHHPIAPKITVDLEITMPAQYPIYESSTLQIDASLSAGSGSGAKRAIDAIPDLLIACRSVALENAGQEAVFMVLSRADEWVHNEWQGFRDDGQGTVSNPRNETSATAVPIPKVGHSTVLARKLIYSHHIIAKTKRKAIADLSRAYQLGGFAKIGWPGIIIIEGDEINCNKFIDEIRTMRWQHIVVRGEELVPVPVPDDISVPIREKAETMISQLDRLRVFPISMQELGEDQMSYLASKCRDVGLEDLFKTSMKIYKKSDDGMKIDPEVEVPHEGEGCGVYGALIHVDHMNDRKSYEKWVLKACKSAGCQCIIKRCFKNDNSSLRPIIFVFLLGEESSIRQILKRWRTSRVDVDSRGNPCLERMMSVLAEEFLVDAIDLNSVENTSETTVDEFQELVKAIGGSSWESAALSYIQ